MMKPPTALLFLLTSLCPLYVCGKSTAEDWIHWRGPAQDGSSAEKDLPDNFKLAGGVGSNLLWQQPYGCRSTPLVMNDRVYIINAVGEGVKEGERVMCFDAATGKVLWEQKFNVFHADIVSNRLGWTNLTADPATGYVYAHATSGMLFCFNRDGKIVWSRSLTEEYGRISGYGGRLTTPIFDSGLVIVGMSNASWGDQARGLNRFVAFDGKTGQVAWWSEPVGPPPRTYYSSPVVATINGVRTLVSGCSEGSVVGLKVATGEKLWAYPVTAEAVNCTPIVDGTRVYVTHGASNTDTNVPGRVVCFDAGQLTNGKPKLVWEYKSTPRVIKAEYTTPVLHDGKLYVCEDGASIYCFDAATGKQLWREPFKYGRLARGSAVWADGKIYVFDVNGNFHIIKPTDSGAEDLFTIHFRSKTPGFVETNGTPAVANGCVYLATLEDFYCISKTGYRKAAGKPALAVTGPTQAADAKVTHLQVEPADVLLHPSGKAAFKVRGFNARGEFVKELPATWGLPAPTPPPPPPGSPPPAPGPGPPPLRGEVSPAGELTVDAKVPAQQGYVEAAAEGLKSRARVRVAPILPYKQDFEKVPVGAPPAGWVNAAGRFVVVEHDGSKVLKKQAENSNPFFSKANAYITAPTTTDYTIAADVSATQVRGGLPDAGVVANRYSLVLRGQTGELRLVSWEARPRLQKEVPFPWKPGVWYRMKLTVEVAGDTAKVRGKVWERGQPEPAAWTVEVDDPFPDREGSAALYGYSSNILEGEAGAEAFFDNVSITPNKPAGAAGGGR
jgi:outer membrane protein assembly factor BamB